MTKLLIFLTVPISIFHIGCNSSFDQKENDLYRQKYETLLMEEFSTFWIDRDQRKELAEYATPDSSLIVWTSGQMYGYNTMTVLTKFGDVIMLVYQFDTLRSVLHSKGKLVNEYKPERGYIPEKHLTIFESIFKYNISNEKASFCFLDSKASIPSPTGPVFHFSIENTLDSVQFYRNGNLSDTILIFKNGTDSELTIRET